MLRAATLAFLCVLFAAPSRTQAPPDSVGRLIDLHVPIGGGAGKLFRIGKQPINTTLQAYYNVETPTFGPDWQLRFQVQFLF